MLSFRGGRWAQKENVIVVCSGGVEIYIASLVKPGAGRYLLQGTYCKGRRLLPKLPLLKAPLTDIIHVTVMKL